MTEAQAAKVLKTASGKERVLAITLGPRPGELRQLTWERADAAGGVVGVWRSAGKTGGTKTRAGTLCSWFSL